MTNPHELPPRLSPLEYDALVTAAKARAVRARREAIDAFWAAAARLALTGWHALRRAVRGLSSPAALRA